MARQLTRLQVKSLNGNYWNMLVPKLNLLLVKSFMNWCHRRCVYHYCDKSYNSMKTCRYHYKKLARCLSLFWQILHLSLALSDMATYSDSTVPSLHLLSWLCSWIAGWLASCLDDTKFQLKRCCICHRIFIIILTNPTSLSFCVWTGSFFVICGNLHRGYPGSCNPGTHIKKRNSWQHGDKCVPTQCRHHAESYCPATNIKNWWATW